MINMFYENSNRWWYKLVDSISGASAKVTELPGCSNIGIIHESQVPPDKRSEGHGSRVHKERLDFLKENGKVEYVLCTVNRENYHQLAIVRKNNWKELDRMIINVYGEEHTIIIFGKKL